MDFGLGLILSFTDNATAGINNAVNSLNQLTEVAGNASTSLNQMTSLSALSVVTDQMGSSFLNAGQTIFSTLGQIISKVNDTGQTLMFAEMQLDKLYENSGRTGASIIGDIQAYAKSSIFEFEDLISVVTNLKAVGIEAFDTIASSTGASQQTLMDYAADLASFAPTMRNAYGTGIQASMGALKEYIAEGNAMSLKRGAGLDITAILGEDKGATIEERSRQVADLLEQLGMVGMTANMANTPMTKLSNMSDTLFQFLGMVSSSGVYDKFNELISKFADYVMAIPEEELENIAKSVGSALTSIMKPLEWIVDKVLDVANSIRALVANNPQLIKIATVGVTIAGVFLVLAGVALKVTSAMSGLSLMLLTFGKSFKDIGTLIRTGSLKILGTLLPLTTAIALFAFAWKNDFAGIRTNVTEFVKGVVGAFKTAKQSISGSVEDLTTSLNDLRSKGDFFSNLTIGIMKVMMAIQALSDCWNDNELSEENYLKAKELGILPLIEAILDLKYKFEFFKQGFLDGWREIGERIKSTLQGFLDNVEGTALEGLVNNLTEFLQKLASGDTQAWYDFGQSFADFTLKALIFFEALSIFKKVSTIFSGISKVIAPLISLIMTHPIVALIVGIITAIGVLYAKSESFRDLITSVFGQLKQVAIEALMALLPSITNVFEAIKGFLPQLIDLFKKIGESMSSIIESIIGLVMQIIPIIMEVIGSVINTIVDLMPTIMNIITTVVNIFTTLFGIISELIDMVVPFLVDIISQIGKLISDILPVVADLLSNVVDAIMNVINLVLPMLKSIIEALMPIIKTIMNIISAIVAKLVPVIKSLVSIISNVIKMIIDIITPIITVVMQIVQAIIKVLAPIVDIILKAVGFIIDIILGIVQVVISVVEAIVAVISGIVGFIMSIINVIVQIVMSLIEIIVGIVTTIIETITGIISGIITVIQSIWDFMVNTFSNAVSFFSGVFTSVFEVISGIFNNIADFFTTVWNGIVEVFSTISDVISETVRGAINKVIGGAVNIINGFIKAINLAVGVINEIPGVQITKLTELSVPQLAKGGVVETPTLSLIGEAGKEAVVPLENNLGWISQLASMLTDKMNNNIVPANNRQYIENGDTNNQSSYLTTNNNNTQTVQGDTNNSVVFSEGSIQITIQNASEEEAIKFARVVMEYIKRQQELDRMLQYG